MNCFSSKAYKFPHKHIGVTQSLGCQSATRTITHSLLSLTLCLSVSLKLQPLITLNLSHHHKCPALCQQTQARVLSVWALFLPYCKPCDEGGIPCGRADVMGLRLDPTQTSDGLVRGNDGAKKGWLCMRSE